MKKILFLTSGYCGKSTANGLCTKVLAEEMIKNGTEVFVISAETDTDTEQPSDHIIPIIYTPKKPNVPKNYIARKFLALIKVFSALFAPEHKKELVSRIVAEAKNICFENSIDAVVSMYFPLVSLSAGYKLKKLFPTVKYMIYELDSVSDGIGVQGKWRKYVNYTYRRFLNTLYKKADLIMILKCHENHWRKEHPKHLLKMQVVDLPLLYFPEMPVLPKHESNTVSFLYAGVLDHSYRSPKPLYDTFCKIGLELVWELNFYSKGCEEFLKNAEQEIPGIKSHGYVDQKTLLDAIAQTDILISIGNAVSNSMPSKIITYITYKKPIIHFSLQENDICVEYLNKYPLALVIPYNSEPEDSTIKIVDFINELSLKTVTNEEILNNYRMNIPAYSAEIILDHIDRHSK
ncbi:MAG: hypothetical protein IJ391_07330 [Clostridia bacterium]|nr:hypothetical protein [Clostridia bacterium]